MGLTQERTVTLCWRITSEGTVIKADFGRASGTRGDNCF